MTDLIEKIARKIAPHAWAALGTGDTLSQLNRRKASLKHARAALSVITSQRPVGYLIDHDTDKRDDFSKQRLTPADKEYGYRETPVYAIPEDTGDKNAVS